MSSVHPHRVFALLCSGSAWLTHAAVWFTLDPSLQRCHPDTCSPSYICAAGYSHLSKGKCVCTRMYMGATSIPEVSTAWCNPGGLWGVGRVGRERMQKDAMSVWIQNLLVSLTACNKGFVYCFGICSFFCFSAVYYFAFLIWLHLANPFFLTPVMDTANPLNFEIWICRSPGFKCWSHNADS